MKTKDGKLKIEIDCEKWKFRMLMALALLIVSFMFACMTYITTNYDTIDMSRFAFMYACAMIACLVLVISLNFGMRSYT